MELTKTSQLDMETKGDDKFSQQISQAEELVESGDFPSALNKFHGIIDQSPDSETLFSVYKQMGNIYLKCSDIEAAEEAYNKASRIRPNHVSLLVNYGVLEIHKKKMDTAKLKFIEALEVDAHSDLAWVGLALVHRSFSDFDLSRACLLRALDCQPSNKTALLNYYQWCQEDGIEPSSSFVGAIFIRKPQ